MFTDYFSAQAAELQKALDANLSRDGAKSPARGKDVGAFREFFGFLKDHLPAQFSLATGKVRGKKHLLNKGCDLLIYDRWCSRFLEMAGGYVLVDSVYAAVSLEKELTTQALNAHVSLSSAVKSLYHMSTESPDNQIVPLFTILLAYSSRVPLISHKTAIRDAAQEREVPIHMEPDMVCVMDQGMIIKDWENAGDYKVVETGPDTLMWFFVLLLEYLDRDGVMKYQLRDYIRGNRTYKEY